MSLLYLLSEPPIPFCLSGKCGESLIDYLASHSESLMKRNNLNTFVRRCAGNVFVPFGDPRECVSQCQNPPMCGPIQIPEEHLKVRLVRMFCTCDSLYQVIIFLQQLIIEWFYLYT